MTAALGIPRFDPLARRGPVYRGLDAFIRTKAGRRFAMQVSARFDPVLLRVSHGYVSTGMVLPSANLVTTGARSGQPRSCTILYFSDGDDIILIASSFGRDRHPAWYHNLKAHPEARLDRAGRSGRYLATEVTDEAERERLFGLADRVYGGYADYRRETAAVGRSIPILRLTLAP